jgi:hypothetical protein
MVTAKVEENEPRVHKHSIIISGYWTINERLHWRYGTKNIGDREMESIEIRFPIIIRDTPAPQKTDALKRLLEDFEDTSVPWIVPTPKDWAFDLDRMKQDFNSFQRLHDKEWCRGRVFIEPVFEVDRERTDFTGRRYYETSIVFYVNATVLGMRPSHIASPVEIELSLRHFQLDYPDPNKIAFIMMKFGSTSAHDNIVKGIEAALAPHGIRAVRADTKEYHTDLYYNILTYIYGCGFGIAVFERIEREDFNPNVSLEVGYLLALKKEVCLLKDKTLTTLHTDLVGKLYRTFDPQDPVSSIPPQLSKWMSDRGIV